MLCTETEQLSPVSKASYSRPKAMLQPMEPGASNVDSICYFHANSPTVCKMDKTKMPSKVRTLYLLEKEKLVEYIVVE
jgi:hypothetical protein